MSQLTWLLFSNVLLPWALSAVGAAFPPFAFILNIPIFGSWLRGKIEAVCKKLFDAGVVTVKTEILDKLEADAKRGYEPMIELLREAQNKEFLSEEEELEYEERLKDSVRNHPSVVNG